MLTQPQKKTLFRLYPVLSRVAPKLLEEALAKARVVHLERGTTVFEEMSPCNAFPFVLEGTLRVFKQSVNGRELSLYTVTPGEACIVTAGCLIGHRAYNALGEVKADVDMVMLPQKDFEDLLACPPFREFIFSLVSNRILEMMQLVEEVAFQKLDCRLGALLLRSGPTLKVSHQDLAHELGTVREMITRLLNGFADSGLITLGRGRIDIVDETGLQMLLKG